MPPIVSINNLSKVYASGLTAVNNIHLAIHEGEILALLGPNGAGKTTLISMICGIVNATSGQVLIGGFDNKTHYRQAREQIGLVPQEISLGIFEHVWNTVCYSRGLFGKSPDKAYIEQLLKDLSLFEKKDQEIRTLSGGMKRRVLIAKALSHQPRVLFLDEPTAGVDVELRRDMWALVSKLHQSGVTIILTTHYIEEAEAIADRVAIIDNGKITLIDEKKALMQKLGKRQLTVELKNALSELPTSLQAFPIEIAANGYRLIYRYDSQNTHNDVSMILQLITEANLAISDLNTSQSSLEDIFVDLIKK